MIVRGTSKIRGVLSLQLNKTSILEVTPNAVKHLSQDDFNKHEIQQAVALGYLKVEQQKGAALETPTVSGNIEISEEKKIKCKNMHSRPLAMKNFPLPIAPGKEFTITEQELHSPDIKSAVQKGYIKVLEAKIPIPVTVKKNDKNEATINVSKTLLQEQIKDSERAQNTRYLMNDHQSLETNEELSTPTSVVDRGVKGVNMKTPVIDNPDPDPVQATDVKRNTVVWNPTRRKTTNTMRSDQDSPLIDQESPKPEHNVEFVDQEQLNEKIKSHPKLKDSSPVVVEEPQFVDQIQEQQRIQTHPVLKSIEEEFSDESTG